MYFRKQGLLWFIVGSDTQPFATLDAACEVASKIRQKGYTVQVVKIMGDH